MMIGRLVFGVVRVMVILLGLVFLMFLIWFVRVLVLDVVVGFLWCISENIMLVGVSGLLLWKLIFWCSLNIYILVFLLLKDLVSVGCGVRLVFSEVRLL